MITVASPRRTRTQRQAPRWAATVARDLRLRPATIEARVHSTSHVRVQDEAALIIRRALQFGAPHIAEKIFAPIEAAFAGIEAVVLTPHLQRDVQEADMAEDIAEARFNADPTPATKAAFMAALRVQMATTRRLLVALEGA